MQARVLTKLREVGVPEKTVSADANAPNPVVAALEGGAMNRASLGALLGVTVGVADVLLMLPLQFQDRTAALVGAARTLRPRVLRSNGPIATVADLGWHCGRTSDQRARCDHDQDLMYRFWGMGALFGAVCGWAVGGGCVGCVTPKK